MSERGLRWTLALAPALVLGAVVLDFPRDRPVPAVPVAGAVDTSRATRYPHEPAGFEAFAEEDFSTIPTSNELAPGGKLGLWYTFVPRGGGGGGGAGGGQGRGGEHRGGQHQRAQGQTPPASAEDGGEDTTAGEEQQPAPSARPMGRQHEGMGGGRRVPRLTVIQDPSAPESPPDVFAMLFPAGWVAGRGPVNWGGWDAHGTGEAGEKEKLYLSFWIKLDGSDWENQAVGTKILFIGSGFAENAKGQSGNQSVLFLKGVGKRSIQPAFQVEFHQFLPKTQITPKMPFFRPQNVSRKRTMTAGRWHHWEVVMEANHPTQRDGRLSWWIDGELVMQYNDMVYRLPQAPRGFWRLKCNPTWGGTGETKTRDDRILVDHLYLSGVASAGAAGSPQ